MTPLQQLYHDLVTLRCRFEADEDDFYYNFVVRMMRIVDQLMRTEDDMK